MVEISTSGKGRAVGLGLRWHFWRSIKGAGMCFTLALMVDKPWFMMLAKHWAQAAELWRHIGVWRTSLFNFKCCRTGDREGSIGPPAAWSSGNSGFSGFSQWQKPLQGFWAALRLQSQELHHFRCPKEGSSKREGKRNLRHYWDGHTKKASSKDRSLGMNLPNCSTVLIFMLLIAIIFPRTICICHKYLTYSLSFICT